MTFDPATGVPHPDRPGTWLVPPWPPEATLTEVVHHFLCHYLWENTDTACRLAYAEAYQAAFAAARDDAPPCPIRERWHSDMRDSLQRCVNAYRKQLDAEANQGKENIEILKALSQAARHVPRRREFSSR